MGRNHNVQKRLESSLAYCGRPKLLKKKSGRSFDLSPKQRRRAFCQPEKGCLPGFTLTEVVIVMALVFFLMLGLGELLCHSFLLKQKADLAQVSAALLSKKLEYFKSLGPQHKLLQPGFYEEIVRVDNSNRNFLLSWEVSEYQGMTRIYLSVSLLPGGKKKPLRGVLLMSDEIGF